MEVTQPTKVSVHGGHSGEFCGHAHDDLTAIVTRYIQLGYEWICITEHMPPTNPRFIPAEEAEAGFDVEALQARFTQYFREARRLAQTHADRLRILVGFETEAYTGYQTEAVALIRKHKPDMLVGSVHHVHDVPIDGTPEEYHRAVQLSGSIESLYCDYFDKQLELVETLTPPVVGHFDLIRMHDPAYPERWNVATVRARALRNLKRIKELGLILDLNVRALAKGASEPYLSSPWLNVAIEKQIPIVPGDDSHGVASVGAFFEEGIDYLLSHGGHTDWKMP